MLLDVIATKRNRRGRDPLLEVLACDLAARGAVKLGAPGGLGRASRDGR